MSTTFDSKPSVTQAEVRSFWRERRRKFNAKYGRAMAYDDILKPLGQSQDTGRRDCGGVSQDRGIISQT